ncbi:MAG: ribonuclease III [Chloroflexi bacterium]|nr:ribonuclease III [Chloroflexota bacterium]
MNELTPQRRQELEAFARRLGLTFRDWNWLNQAFIHSSYRNEHPEVGQDNQRLEFLGDALLDFIVADWLCQQHPDWDEGTLTAWRAALVRGEQLAHWAAALGFEDVLLLGRGNQQAFARARTSILADAFEAFIGALYRDQGLDAVQAFLLPLLERGFVALQQGEAPTNPKTRLQEWTQARGLGTPQYRVVHKEGPAHAPHFVVEVLVNGEVWGRGEGSSKRRAERAAAHDAWQRHIAKRYRGRRQEEGS